MERELASLNRRLTRAVSRAAWASWASSTFSPGTPQDGSLAHLLSAAKFMHSTVASSAACPLFAPHGPIDGLSVPHSLA